MEVMRQRSQVKASVGPGSDIMVPPPESHELAAEIRSALQQTPRLTIKDLADRWPQHYRDGYLVCEIYDADGYHDWPGLTDVGLLALDLLDEQLYRPRAVPIVPIPLDAWPIDRTEPNTPTTADTRKQ